MLYTEHSLAKELIETSISEYEPYWNNAKMQLTAVKNEQKDTSIANTITDAGNKKRKVRIQVPMKVCGVLIDYPLTLCRQTWYNMKRKSIITVKERIMVKSLSELEQPDMDKFRRPSIEGEMKNRRYWEERFFSQLRQKFPMKYDYLMVHPARICVAMKDIEEHVIADPFELYGCEAYHGDLKQGNIEYKTLGRAFDSKGCRTALAASAGLSNEDKEYPCGCFFILLPRTDDEYYRITWGETEKFDLEKSWNCLYGIVTSEESKSLLRKMLLQEGFNPEIVYTFSEFIDREPLVSVEDLDKCGSTTERLNFLRERVAALMERPHTASEVRIVATQITRGEMREGMEKLTGGDQTEYLQTTLDEQ